MAIGNPSEPARGPAGPAAARPPRLPLLRPPLSADRRIGFVRMVLVPAIMQLLGPANWWLPRWAGPGARQLRHRAGRE